jgi:hypothetical protein
MPLLFNQVSVLNHPQIINLTHKSKANVKNNVTAMVDYLKNTLPFHYDLTFMALYLLCY